MKGCLLTWIGKADLAASRGEAKAGVGPIGQAVQAREFKDVVLLTDFPEDEITKYVAWLESRTPAKISVRRVKLSGPTNLSEIYPAARDALEDLTSSGKGERRVTVHISPGTSSMAAVWILLAKARFQTELIESSLEAGVRTVDVPFDIAADFVPDLLRGSDEALGRLSEGAPPDAPAFGDIIYRSNAMRRVVVRAQVVAARSVPVLIEGESGTGKELLARAIHQSGPRRDREMVVVNCGAIPSELIESELFGHKKGAFTGATDHHEGYFEAANKSTLLLDEVGELPAAAQVKLLRILQEGEVTRIGETARRPIDVRVIAATNRILANEVTAGRFREDLFHRLAVAVLKLPPLRERQGDVGLLLDKLLEQVNGESRTEPGYKNKKVSAGARNVLLTHHWPGNVREMLNTLRRAAVWSAGTTINEEEARDAIITASRHPGSRLSPLEQPIEQGIDITAIIDSVYRHYISRALEIAGGSKTKAAELLGVANYQTLSNWMKKYRIKT
jgi:transcriptional regulator with GAF, ATPase, and Fis domain